MGMAIICLICLFQSRNVLLVELNVKLVMVLLKRMKKATVLLTMGWCINCHRDNVKMEGKQ
jgi:hypothetical protein